MCQEWSYFFFSRIPFIFHPPLAPYIIQRKFQKIERKIFKVSILIFLAVKHIQKLFYGIGLHSCGPDTSFDTHIAPPRHDKIGCCMRHLCQKCQKCHIWHKCHPTQVISRYGHMGVKRSIRTSGMLINAIKQTLRGFKGLEMSNYGFLIFSFVSFKISFV